MLEGLLGGGFTSSPRRGGRIGLDGYFVAQSGALGVVPDPRILQCGGLFLLAGAEFPALILPRLCGRGHGAFPVRGRAMLDADFAEFKQGKRYAPIGALGRADLRSC